MTEPPITSTALGALRGCVEDGLCAFRGVPYAAPPVGRARWRAAQPHPGWDGVRGAAQYGPSAPQPWRPGGLPPVGAPFIQGLSPEVVERITGVLHNAWIHFVRDGDPNRESAPSWRPYTAQDRAVLVVGDENIQVVTDKVKAPSGSL